MPIKVQLTQAEINAITGRSENVSVPQGHRAKCRTCGAVDNVKLTGDRKLKRCGACGSTLAMRRAPRKPRIISFVVILRLNGVDYSETPHVDLSQATAKALLFVEQGPVAKERTATIVELLDNESTGKWSTLKYENFRGRTSSVAWVPGCVACKGKGLIPTVLRPAYGGAKAVVKFLPCVSCNSLGGELSRRVMFPRHRRIA